ncbi:hypothetical protein JVU11DRAFT_4267 [Chiua virens]|nr:hypothetical protein JVU11DRAFT_4267 [Chiua virens]
MENFINGHAGCEFQIRDALATAIGKDKSHFFFNKFLEYFFAEPDAAFFKSLGLNCIRIAVNYRHLEDDDNPRVLKAEGFVTSTVSSMRVQSTTYTPSSTCTPHLVDKMVVGIVIRRYIWQITHELPSNNELADPLSAGLIRFYDRIYEAIHNVDKNHILFLGGNTYSTDFSAFPGDAKDRWKNTVYAIHDYAVYGFPASPAPYDRSPEQIKLMRDTYQHKRAWMDQRGLCV